MEIFGKSVPIHIDLVSTIVEKPTIDETWSKYEDAVQVIKDFTREDLEYTMKKLYPHINKFDKIPLEILRDFVIMWMKINLDEYYVIKNTLGYQ